jgi:hypothetical protein
VTVSTCWEGTSTARTQRSASARRCQVCQVERSRWTTATTRFAAFSSHARVGTTLARDRVEGGVDHGLDAGFAAENLAGLRPPVRSLLGQGAGFVLGVAGLQGGLLGEGDRLNRGRGRP